MYDLLKEFIKPELLILVPVLYLVGIAIKNSNAANKWIPWILGMESVLLCGLYILATSEISDWRSSALAVFTAITQGTLIAGASVYVNQLIKQSKKVE